MGGAVAHGFGGVGAAFRDLLASGRETGAAVAVVRGGRLVVDLWGGWTDVARTRPWQDDTLVQVFSAGKPLAALTALRLVGAGVVDLDAPVARVWPAYGAHGKEATTLRHVLCHQAGMPAFPAGHSAGDLLDGTTLRAALAAGAPEWAPGTAHGEHALTYGHIIDGVVRGATGGRSLGAVFREQVAAPLGLDAAFGLGPADLGRAADLEPGPGWESVAGPAGTLRHRALTRPPGALDVAVLNGDAWRRAEFPAIGLHATARALARFYADLCSRDGPVAGLVGRDAWRGMVTPEAAGTDLLLERDVAWTLGMQREDDLAGMGGIGGCDALAWLGRGAGYAYVTRHLSGHDRSESVLTAVEDALGGP